jgi:hypothetical protein
MFCAEIYSGNILNLKYSYQNFNIFKHLTF